MSIKDTEGFPVREVLPIYRYFFSKMTPVSEVVKEISKLSSESKSELAEAAAKTFGWTVEQK